jgi:hypothetical protein
MPLYLYPYSPGFEVDSLPFRYITVFLEERSYLRLVSGYYIDILRLQNLELLYFLVVRLRFQIISR